MFLLMDISVNYFFGEEKQLLSMGNRSRTNCASNIALTTELHCVKLKSKDSQ